MNEIRNHKAQKPVAYFPCGAFYTVYPALLAGKEEAAEHHKCGHMKRIGIIVKEAEDPVFKKRMAYDDPYQNKASENIHFVKIFSLQTGCTYLV